MKRKKNSRKVRKNKLFRKRTSKTYKRSRRGGAIDWGKPQTSPGTPQKKATPSSSSASSSASSHSPKKGSFKSSPPRHSPLKKLTSLKTLVEKKNTPHLTKPTPELYSSISHVQEQQPAPPFAS